MYFKRNAAIKTSFKVGYTIKYYINVVCPTINVVCPNILSISIYFFFYTPFLRDIFIMKIIIKYKAEGNIISVKESLIKVTRLGLNNAQFFYWLSEIFLENQLLNKFNAENSVLIAISIKA